MLKEILSKLCGENGMKSRDNPLPEEMNGLSMAA
jgi:hypothetical protein